MKMRALNKIAVSALFITTTVCAFSMNEADESGIYTTKHNLLRGVIVPKGEEKPEFCMWGHIPHDSLSGDTEAPKWLPQGENESTFGVYGMDQNVSGAQTSQTPDVMVRVCLTCHDGVNAPNISLFSEEAPQKFNLNTATASVNNEPLPNGSFVHSHPVGINYSPYSESGSKASLRPETFILNGWSGAKTIRDLVSEGTVRCTSCHDPHTTNGLFLRTSNRGSALCKGCHNK